MNRKLHIFVVLLFVLAAVFNMACRPPAPPPTPPPPPPPPVVPPAPPPVPTPTDVPPAIIPTEDAPIVVIGESLDDKKVKYVQPPCPVIPSTTEAFDGETTKWDVYVYEMAYGKPFRISSTQLMPGWFRNPTIWPNKCRISVQESPDKGKSWYVSTYTLPGFALIAKMKVQGYEPEVTFDGTIIYSDQNENLVASNTTGTDQKILTDKNGNVIRGHYPHSVPAIGGGIFLAYRDPSNDLAVMDPKGNVTTRNNSCYMPEIRPDGKGVTCSLPGDIVTMFATGGERMQENIVGGMAYNPADITKSIATDFGFYYSTDSLDLLQTKIEDLGYGRGSDYWGIQAPVKNVTLFTAVTGKNK